MKTLAIDTSSNVATVAIMDDEKLICEYILNHKKTHSQKLMPIISRVLSDCELMISDIDLFAVAVGPGSFTGLRIGVVTTKAFAHAYNKPIVGIPSLDVLANSFSYYTGIVCPIINAKNDQVYTALYETHNREFKPITDYMGIPFSDLIQQIKEVNKKTLFVGDGVPYFKEKISDELGDMAEFASKSTLNQRASVVAELALTKYSLGQYDNYLTLAPFYLRKSQAERMKEINQCT